MAARPANNSDQSNNRSNERAEPGSKGGNFYRIELRPKEEFVRFRTQDVGKRGGLERLGGQRSDGSWDTQAWLVSKDYAHAENGVLVPDHEHAADLFKKLGGVPRRVKGNTFTIERTSS